MSSSADTGHISPKVLKGSPPVLQVSSSHLQTWSVLTRCQDNSQGKIILKFYQKDYQKPSFVFARQCLWLPQSQVWNNAILRSHQIIWLSTTGIHLEKQTARLLAKMWHFHRANTFPEITLLMHAVSTSRKGAEFMRWALTAAVLHSSVRAKSWVIQVQSQQRFLLTKAEQKLGKVVYKTINLSHLLLHRQSSTAYRKNWDLSAIPA